MSNDPFVEEIHRVREQMLEDSGGTIEGLLKGMRERRDRGDYADREFVTRPPTPASRLPKRAVG